MKLATEDCHWKIATEDCYRGLLLKLPPKIATGRLLLEDCN